MIVESTAYRQRIAEQVQKLVNTERIVKEDSPKDNLLSEKAAKKIHEAGNCESHEVQRRTDEVQCQRCYSYMEARFQVCPCGGKLNMSEEMLSGTIQNIKQLIADAYMTFQGTRGAKHGAHPWQKHHFFSKEFMRKNNKNEICTSILDRYQNDEVFHASQVQHNWTREWFKYLDYIRTIDITRNASPEQLERYAALYHFRYHPKYMEKAP